MPNREWVTNERSFSPSRSRSPITNLRILGIWLFTEKLWVCASPFQGIINKNFHD
ncbi:MAG: hypothetical protein F6K18_09360 [Okeania sp. SIO2C2]|uniref:hypothetical protein n=1 Tax=Okeania sp. SIO2C2 TaxID=2607787 RepID=UPI0013BDA99E|nr:hypothetical protein [Okeania sp. SIO2C2]NEP87027.1 hypothetical protein [Okeania sp. SIO2C2]